MMSKPSCPTLTADVVAHLEVMEALEKHWNKQETPASTTWDGEKCDTPTHSSTPTLTVADPPPPQSKPQSQSQFQLYQPGAPACPRGGATFVIRDPQTGFVIALDDGVPALHLSDMAHDRSSHWRCIENDKLWLGFKNAASGCYMGHNNKAAKWRLIAQSKKHETRQFFCARQHPDGGNLLLVKHNDGFLAVENGGDGGRELVVLGKGVRGGTSWEFIRVDGDV